MNRRDFMRNAAMLPVAAVVGVPTVAAMTAPEVHPTLVFGNRTMQTVRLGGVKCFTGWDPYDGPSRSGTPSTYAISSRDWP